MDQSTLQVFFWNLWKERTHTLKKLKILVWKIKSCSLFLVHVGVEKNSFLA